MTQADMIVWLLVVMTVLLTLLVFLHIKILKIFYFLFPMSKKISKKPCIFPWKTKWTKNYSPSSMFPYLR